MFQMTAGVQATWSPYFSVHSARPNLGLPQPISETPGFCIVIGRRKPDHGILKRSCRMSPTLRHRLSFVLSLLIVAGIVYGVVVAGRATLRVLTTLESSVAVSIIAAAGTLLVSVLSIVLGKVYEARSVAKKDIRDRKIPVYEDLINFMFRMLMGEKTGTVPNEDEMLKFMSSFTQRIMRLPPRLRQTVKTQFAVR